MGNDGTERGASNTMVLGGFISMEGAAVGNTGIHTFRKILGMRDSLIMDSIIALKTQFNSGKFQSLLR